ncbi:MAG TPA: hypothetical protein DEH22_08785 [Chloroflexi bacterium]|nr:hypothetical protein [Chloroflexota bacterium]
MAEQKTTHRSEQIRANRETPSKRTPARKAKATAQHDTRKNMPPVVVRGGFSTMAQPKSKRKTKQPKRRYDIALASPGVEIRLPAIPTVHVGWRLASLVLVSALAFLLYHLWTTPLYQVQLVELQGSTYLNNETINRLLNLYNKPIFSIDSQQVAEDLKLAFPGVLKDVSVQIGLPASVFVTVEERQPLIAWEQDGKITWVDAEGIGFDPAGENDSLITVAATAPPPAPFVVPDESISTEIPAESGNPLEEILTPQAFMTPEMVAAILAMHEQTPEGAPVVYNPQHGLGWHDDKRGWDVYFGMDISNIAEKLVVYKAIKVQLREAGISPVLISVEHIHAPFYRLEP